MWCGVGGESNLDTKVQVPCALHPETPIKIYRAKISREAAFRRSVLALGSAWPEQWGGTN